MFSKITIFFLEVVIKNMGRLILAGLLFETHFAEYMLQRKMAGSDTRSETVESSLLGAQKTNALLR